MHPSLVIIFIVDNDRYLVCAVYASVCRTVLRLDADQLVVGDPVVLMPVCQVAVFSLLAECRLERLRAVAAAIQCCCDRDKLARPEAVIVPDDRSGRIITRRDADLFTGRKGKVSHHSSVIGHCVCNSCRQLHGNGFAVADRSVEYDIDILAVTRVSG